MALRLPSAATVRPNVYEIDHVPIGYRELPQLTSAFEGLGFLVSGICVYRSSYDPLESWTCRAVFLEHGWLDLQWHPNSANAQALPHGCLFRAPSLAAAKADLAPFRLGATGRLTRVWDDGHSPSLDLGWMSLRERIAPMVLSIVEYPDGDPALEEQRSHPNGARRLLGLTFGDAASGPVANAAASKLDLSGFSYLTKSAFEDKFGEHEGPLIAMRFGVASLDHTASALSERRVPFLVSDLAITVPRHGVLGFGLEFAEVEP